jgi:hypothetical protein
MTRTLTLRREALTDLTTDELAGVVAGQDPNNTKTCPDWTYPCITGYALCGESKLPVCV